MIWRAFGDQIFLNFDKIEKNRAKGVPKGAKMEPRGRHKGKKGSPGVPKGKKKFLGFLRSAAVGGPVGAYIENAFAKPPHLHVFPALGVRVCWAGITEVSGRFTDIFEQNRRQNEQKSFKFW